MFDTSGEGVLPVAQIDHVLRALGQTIPEAQLLAMKQAKLDEGESVVTFAEFVQLVADGETEAEAQHNNVVERATKFRRALSLFDPTGSGWISIVDLRKALRESLKESEIDALIKKAATTTAAPPTTADGAPAAQPPAAQQQNAGKVQYQKLAEQLFGVY